MSDFKELNGLIDKGLVSVCMDNWKPKYYLTDLGQAVMEELKEQDRPYTWEDDEYINSNEFQEFLSVSEVFLKTID